MARILMDNRRSVNSTDREKHLDVNLKETSKFLHYTNIKEDVDLYEQYTAERAESTKYRLIFTIRPYCTNILFNPLTEIARYTTKNGWEKVIYFPNEGEDEEKMSTEESVVVYGETNPDKEHLIQNTEYTDSEHGDFVYYPGFDIFDNHLLRSRTFAIVNPVTKGGDSNFNTLWDKAREPDGDVIKLTKRLKWDDIVETDMHLYQEDDVLKFYDAEKETFDSFEANISEEDGWFGFANASTMNTRVKADKSEPFKDRYYASFMNNANPCSFIDMYPDRSLFGFSPVYNKWEKRDEYNWDVFITYPCGKDVNHPVFDGNGGKGLPIVSFSVAVNMAGTRVVVMKSLVRHNLKRGDTIRLLKKNSETNETSTYEEFAEGEYISVYNVGDINGNDAEYCFMLSNISVVEEFTQANDDGTNLSYMFARVANGINCTYYIRTLKKIPCRSEIYPLAFSEDIYGDGITQIAFTDSVDVYGLKDNLGRPLTELFLTIVKRNKGYKKWYNLESGKNGTSTNPEQGGNSENDSDNVIEMSHCFGEITSGLESWDDIDDELVGSHDAVLKKCGHIRYVKNDSFDYKSGEDEYYCDLVEYSPSDDTETVLSDVYHRFNTCQRENLNDKKMLYHEIVSDDYDPGEWSFETYEISLKNKDEGYYYKPNYKIQIRQLGNPVTASHYDLTVVEATPVIEGRMCISVRTEKSHRLSTGDRVRLYDDGSKEDRYMEFTVTSVTNRARFSMYPVDGKWAYNGSDVDFISPTDICDILSTNVKEQLAKVVTDTPLGDEERLAIMEYRLNDQALNNLNNNEEFKRLKNAYYHRLCGLNTEIPEYANRIGRNKYIWREVYDNGDIRADKIPDRVFTNGATYITETINFYLRRQDPDGKSGLNLLDDPIPNIIGNILPESNYLYKEEMDTTC